MEFTDLLTQILGDPVKIRVYRILFRHSQGMSGRELGRLAETSPFKIHQVLKALVAQGVIVENVAGRAHFYRLNDGHKLVKDIIRPLIEYEADLLRRLGQEIGNRLKPRPLAIILYGSVARGKEKPDSDLDILLLIRGIKGKKRLQAWESGEVFAAVERSYGNPLRVIQMTVSEFQKKSKVKDPLVRNILKEGKTIGGLTFTEVLNYGR